MECTCRHQALTDLNLHHTDCSKRIAHERLCMTTHAYYKQGFADGSNGRVHADHISTDFLDILAQYISPNVTTTEGGATANPEYMQAAYLLWFAANGQTFKGAQID